MDAMERDPQTGKFLDDCVSSVEMLRCMADKGEESIDRWGVTLKAEVFDRCFPGMEWQDHIIGEDPLMVVKIKTAFYRGFIFDTLRSAEEDEDE